MATKAERMSRKRELEDELRTVQAQKAAIVERQAVLEKAAREAQAAREAAAAAAAEARAKAQAQAAQAAAAAAQKAKEKAARENGHRESKKRAVPEPPALPKPVQLTPQEAFDQKRQRVEVDRQRRLSSIWNQCGTILKALKKISHSWPFHVPVDDVKLNIPDYHKIVKKPMDLGTVEKKLAHNPAKGQTREYKHPLEFRDDVRQIWENCRTYNRPGQVVRKAGDKMSDSFEKKWAAADIEKKLNDEKKYRGREDLELAELEANLTGTSQAKALAAKLRKLNAELITELEQSKAAGKSQGAEHNGAMSFEQKRRLSVALGSLPGDKLNRVLDIVSESNAVSMAEGDDEEVELDIDTLDQATLQKLQKYVDSIIPAHSVPSKLPTKSTNTGATKAPAPKERPAISEEKPQRDTVGGKAPQEGEKGKAETKGEGGGAKPSESDSSSSSSDGSSSSSGSDSADGAEHHGSTFNAGDGATGGGAGASDQGGQGQGGDGMEASALVSMTRPAGPAHNSILKSATSKKEVTIQNAGAWASLTQAGNGDGDGKDKGEDVKDDKLWSEFTAREEQQRKREQERKEEEEQLAEEKREKEKEDRARAERDKADVAEAEEKKRREAENEEEESRRAREAERAKELAKLSDMGRAADLGIGADDGEEMMKPTTGGNAGLAMLGLKMKDNDDDDDDEDMEEAYNSGAEDMEDGEV